MGRLVSAQVQVSRIAARPFVSGVSCISLEHWSRQCQIVPRMAFLLIRLATRFWLRSHRHPASGSVRGSIYCVRLESLGMRPGAQPGPECTPSAVLGSVMLRQRAGGALSAGPVVSGWRAAGRDLRKGRCARSARRPGAVLAGPLTWPAAAAGLPLWAGGRITVVGVVWCWLLRACGVAGL